MSVLDPGRPALRDQTAASRPQGLASSPPALMNRGEDGSEKSQLSGLAAHADARALVRLIQCRQCSRPYRSPISLPCGNSVCRECLPKPHHREGLITWPDMALRREAIMCPACASEHPVADYSLDVVLTKVMESIESVVARYGSLTSDVHTDVHPSDRHDEVINETSEKEGKGTFQRIPGGRLMATYMLAVQGQLPHQNDLEFSVGPDEEEQARQAQDTSLLQDLVEATHREVDCQVCYRILLDPVTTVCGHTLCRTCMARVLDHSLYCPVCRRAISIATTLARQETNKTLSNLVVGLCPDTIAQRAAALASEGIGGDGEFNTPLFVCTLAFPHQPTFLRIFEPRYRLMLRRCLEANGEFGILMYNRYRQPQGDLGPVHFYHYGTMLRIIHSQTLADGTSLIETRGVHRFRVLAHGEVDGYAVGKVERVEDVSLAEEEQIEIEETSRLPSDDETDEQLIERTSTRDLLLRGQQFIVRMQQRSAPWLQQRVLAIHGQPPNDAALFPYWFASVLPISEEEKYKLMGTRTVRARLKITAAWISRLESQRWFQSNACRIL